ncbi:MAG: Stp1/IreP family PP2C-type Ser/Thr phosphatase [Clostridia bacterium]|nr:Stp1/IreP family PP2C-type Ser/Thr phosphatase [Clostridia bacterium]
MSKIHVKDNVAKRLKNWKTVTEQVSSTEKALPVDHAVTRTDVGRLRASNQDAVINANGLLGIADGMGGHNGGETASAGARDGLLRELEGREATRENLLDAIRAVNRELFQRQKEDSSLEGMGTTLTVMWKTERNVIIAHAGDSRAYLLRDGEFRQLTEDHSLVAEMVRKGMLTREQAACHPMRNYITRAVGTEADIEADIIEIERKKGDRYLLCSDGLHGLVADSEMKRMLSEADADKAADMLLEAALENGGRDNISLAIFTDEGADC